MLALSLIHRRKSFESTVILRGWINDTKNAIAGKAASRSDINDFLKGDGKLVLDRSKLAAGMGVSIRGRADTLRKTLRQHLDNHADLLSAWEAIGQEVDSASG